MKQESEHYLDKAACIARANMALHQQTPQQDRTPDEAGTAMLMSSFLEMYELWQNHHTGNNSPSRKLYLAAATCVQIRTELEQEVRSKWTDDEEGLFKMMTAYMFLFKQMYAPPH